jgi:hypothetical protein
MTWNAYHRRGETLRDVISQLDERRDGVLPWQAPGVAENFTDDLDLVGALLLKWHARLSGNLERAYALEPVDLPAAVVLAWRTTAEQMPGVRLVVDRASHGDPELARMVAKARHLEHGRLAVAAGLASGPGPDAAAIGRELEDRARADLASLERSEVEREADPENAIARREQELVAPSRDESREEASPSFVDRIKAALAAA